MPAETPATSRPRRRRKTAAPLAPPMHGSSGIFNRLHDAITGGELRFNQRLPSERGMAERFSVARGTVRLALSRLEQAGMVRRKFGSGTFVCYREKFNHEDIAEETSPLELIETRLAIEPHVVRLAVANATQRDLKKLQAALNQAVAAARDRNAFSAADEAFHLLLAHCSQNPLLIWMYQRINDIRAHSQWSERKNNILTPQKIAEYNRQHARLLRMIVRRDMDGAARAMVEHLQSAKRDLLGRG
ncbi:MAG: FCD domain-containing protein [Gammaproteobacteria bacterium]|nr:FCD domain-containing protein [Gammaproteobacteria bacterium]